MSSNNSKTPDLSFEFFPARTEKGVQNLIDVHAELARFEPSFVSVTYGAGGSTQDGTYATVKSMIEAGSSVAPHLTGIGSTRDEIAAIIDGYIELGVNRLVALRGDLPSGMVEQGRFKHATDLIEFIRSRYGDTLTLEVAAYPDFHPQAQSPISDIENLKRKFDAGANSAITQYFFNADSYFAFVDEAQRMGIEAPIIPGIMPISNYASLVRFSDTCGADLPRWIRARLHQYKDDEASLLAFGLDVVTHLCLDLLDNDVEGLHFYALNRVNPVKEICTRIGFQTV